MSRRLLLIPQLGARHTTGRQPSPTPQSGFKPSKRFRKASLQVASRIGEIATTLAVITKGIAGDVGVPGLAVGLSALVEILERVQKASENIERVDALVTRLQELVNILEENRALRINDSGHLEAMQRNVLSLSKKWGSVAEDLMKVKNRNTAMRFIRAKEQTYELLELIRRMDASINDFLLGVGMRTEELVGDIHVNVRLMREDLQQLQGNDVILPRGVLRAEYDSYTRPCLVERTDALDQVDNWIADAFSRKPHSGQILWIDGPANTGKTTLACTIAMNCYRKGILGGNFFGAHEDVECGDPNLLFTTLSRQLCGIHVPFKRLISERLRKNPDIVNYGPIRQLEELIVKPLEEVNRSGKPFPASIIIIDALNEFRDVGIKSRVPTESLGPRSSTVISDGLEQRMPHLAPLLFIITSCTKPHITQLCENSHRESISLSAATDQSPSLAVQHIAPPQPCSDEVFDTVGSSLQVTSNASSQPMDDPRNGTLATSASAPNGNKQEPLVPWLKKAMEELQERYPDDKFSAVFRKGKEPEWRLRCSDCPGRLYNAGPGETLMNYKVHLRNRQHRQKVNLRVNGGGQS